MPVLLTPYTGSTRNPKDKFVRAVDSFLSQSFQDKVLIIISDGCKDSVDICNRKYYKEIKKGLIKLIQRERSNLFTGAVRQAGINEVTGGRLCNLDADDEFMPHHLHNLDSVFDASKLDWVYFNLYRKLDVLKGVEEVVDTQPNVDSLCTASVAWRNGLDATWIGADGRQDNKIFNKQLLDKYNNYKKVHGLGYIVRNAVFSYISN